MNKCSLLVTWIFIAGSAFAHEGHDVPGALPPPPNGGRVEEAAHKEGHAEEHDEDEFFFEALYKNKQLKIFPLVLPHKDPKAFVAVPPAEAKKLSVKIEFPREKRTVPAVLAIDGAGFSTKFDAGKAHRFIVHVSAFHQNELKEAAIQVEKE